MRKLQGPKRIVWHRLFDVAGSLIGLLILSPLGIVSAVVSAISTRSYPIFRQTRVGKNGVPFRIAKLRTMRTSSTGSTVTTTNDPRITAAGSLLRRFKLDEIPQLWNVLKGDMAFVGPRPDVPGFADELDGWAEQVLSVRPGITGPATLLFRNEETLLGRASNPEQINQEIIYPTKTVVNLAWLNNATLLDDLKLIWMTIFAAAPDQILELVEQWEPGLTSESPIKDFLQWKDPADTKQPSETQHANARVEEVQR